MTRRTFLYIFFTVCVEDSLHMHTCSTILWQLFKKTSKSTDSTRIETNFHLGALLLINGKILGIFTKNVLRSSPESKLKGKSVLPRLINWAIFFLNTVILLFYYCFILKHISGVVLPANWYFSYPFLNFLIFKFRA